MCLFSSNEIQLLGTNLNSMQQLISETKDQASEARKAAEKADTAALSGYTQAKAVVPEVDVDGLKTRAEELNAEVRGAEGEREGALI